MMENILDISLCVIQSRVYNNDNNIVHILYGWKLKTKEKKIVVCAMMGDGQ